MTNVKIPYFKWRDGRPRWEPGPGLRNRGYAGRDLKDAAGEWLQWRPAKEEAERLNKAVKDEATLPAPPTNERRTMSAAIALYRLSPNYLDRTASTRRGYDSLIGFVESWCGDTLVGSITKANLANWHMALRQARGDASANAALRMAKILLYYAADDLEWINRVRARKIKMAETEGRLVLWTMDEINAFVTIADYMGRPDLGDACILGALTGQSRVDLLTLQRGTWSNGIYRFKRTKTGREVKVPMVPQLERRLIASRARIDRRWPNINYLTELVDVETGRAFHEGGKHFEREFRRMRMFAAGKMDAIEGGSIQIGPLPQPDFRNLPFMPSLADKRLQDLRDTAVTWLFMAGCIEAEIATITGHSLKTVRSILDKHYLVRDDAFAISAGKKLEAFLTREKFR